MFIFVSPVVTTPIAGSGIVAGHTTQFLRIYLLVVHLFYTLEIQAL